MKNPKPPAQRRARRETYVLGALALLPLLGCVEAARGSSDETQQVELAVAVPASQLYAEPSSFRLKGVLPDNWEKTHSLPGDIATGGLEELAGNQPGMVKLNLAWNQWEPGQRMTSGNGLPSGCLPLPGPQPAEQTYVTNWIVHNNRCYYLRSYNPGYTPTDGGVPFTTGDHRAYLSDDADKAIKLWSDRGVAVTAVLSGLPDYATHTNGSLNNWNQCTHGSGWQSENTVSYCGPIQGVQNDFGNFAGMLAQRYNGELNRGRISNFVIHNEVNANAYFDVGCTRTANGGFGSDCYTQAFIDKWVGTYAAHFVAAYRAIKAQQPRAQVLVPLTHHFETWTDLPFVNHNQSLPDGGVNADGRLMSVKTFLAAFDNAVNATFYQTNNPADLIDWGVAYHPYNNPLHGRSFSMGDRAAGRVTFGNLGMLDGWLRSRFPRVPSAAKVFLTEQGFDTNVVQYPQQDTLAQAEQKQARMLCDSQYNALGTPGVQGYTYFRMVDVEGTTSYKFGLRRLDGSAKPSWATWAEANRIDVALREPLRASCGFEFAPYMRLSRFYNATTARHWQSTRLPPEGFTREEEETWLLLRHQPPTAQAATRPLYECTPGFGHNFLSTQVGCEGTTPLGLVGYVFTTQQPGTIAMHRCRADQAGNDHWVSASANCEGAQANEGVLGYAWRGVPNHVGIKLEAELAGRPSTVSTMPGTVHSGGAAVSSFDEGDWLSFSGVNVGNGLVAMQVELGSPVKTTAGTQYYDGDERLELRSGSVNGPLLATLHIAGTPGGGWENTQLQTVEVTGASPVGVQNLFLVGKGSPNGGIARLDFVRFIVRAAPSGTPRDGAQRLEAESFTRFNMVTANVKQGEVITQPTASSSPQGYPATSANSHLGSSRSYQQIFYGPVDFKKGVKQVRARLAYPSDKGATSVDLRLDDPTGPLLARINLDSTSAPPHDPQVPWSAWFDWFDKTVDVPSGSSYQLRGVHDVWLVFSNSTDVTYAEPNIDYFEFVLN